MKLQGPTQQRAHRRGDEGLEPGVGGWVQGRRWARNWPRSWPKSWQRTGRRGFFVAGLGCASMLACQAPELGCGGRAGRSSLPLYLSSRNAPEQSLHEPVQRAFDSGLKASYRPRWVQKPQDAALLLAVTLEKGPSQWQLQLLSKKAPRAPAWMRRAPLPLGLAFAPQDWSAAGGPERIIGRLVDMFRLSLELQRRGRAAAREALFQARGSLSDLAATWLVEHPEKDAAIAQRCIALAAAAVAEEPDYDRAERMMHCAALSGSASDVPALLDAISTRHDRLILHRIEALGELGGAIAREELQMVLDNENMGPLHEATVQALRKIGDRSPE